MSDTINLIDATILFLKNFNQAIIADYQLGIFVFNAYTSKVYNDYQLGRIKKPFPEYRDYSRIISNLIIRKIIRQDDDTFPKNRIYKIRNKPSMAPEEILCSLDPFGYISHHSAMKLHELTLKSSKTLYFTSLPVVAWRESAKQLMGKKIEGGEEKIAVYQATGLPVLRPIKTRKITGEIINMYVTNQHGAMNFKNYKRVRVASIGRTFLDMLRKPDFCGGMAHVVEVYKNHAAENLNAVITEIETHGKAIEKVRAGYILEEYCNIKDKIIDGWQIYAQRGGSRKLDPFNNYRPVYSERWSISINL